MVRCASNMVAPCQNIAVSEEDARGSMPVIMTRMEMRGATAPARLFMT